MNLADRARAVDDLLAAMTAAHGGMPSELLALLDEVDTDTGRRRLFELTAVGMLVSLVEGSVYAQEFGWPDALAQLRANEREE